MRFRDQDIVFANGADGPSKGQNFEIPTANPANYFHVISNSTGLAKLAIDGKLFLPASNNRKRNGKLPLVMVVPGSLGVAPSHLAHAETVVGDGFAAFVLDSFGARDVTSTVANQTQFSFAASAYDVLAAWQVLSAHPEIDASRIGAQGHSRGGSAVLTAATRRFADAVVGAGAGFRSVLAAYPWSGHQFLDPSVDETEIRVIMGDADEWCSPMQVQGHCQAIRLSGGRATMRLIGGAQHSFDRGTGIENVPDASVSPAAPTAYIANDGAFIHPLHGVADSKLTDRDLMIYALKAGYGRKGAKIGSRDGDAELFKADMLAFWRRTLG
ncbi:dienelactone hydrolase family protein [Bradyrhizobium sp. AUGA SZCCT0283]|uniref:dienelactone hydrolase family protein n=1 Tax=Bradyrhizobium sp. AUGA SZCCT0283 TaxID=2807671 RepID=UPI001BAD536A|nr:dienelactone hydrolase family protein [Bradyrhizobium sp. AUGA SZCCT0283]MBR1278194.1 dienelactone hydrolase family protein [Bradyrhizobium sp. AUGA SZCCT0283]